jgi:MFS family permease
LLWVVIGWSILEGLGSALIVPAINTLVRANYEGAKRATAYGTLFGVAAAGAAFGPLVGGWITTAYSWRLAFGAEALIVPCSQALDRSKIPLPSFRSRNWIQSE